MSAEPQPLTHEAANGGAADSNGVLERAQREAVVNLRRLIGVARGRRRPLIHLQHNPDPDALGSAAALQALMLRLMGVEATLAYTGRVGRVGRVGGVTTGSVGSVGLGSPPSSSPPPNFFSSAAISAASFSRLSSMRAIPAS